MLLRSYLPLALLLACVAGCRQDAWDLPHSVPGARGGLVVLIAADSPMAVLVVTAECAKSRIGIATYDDIRAMVQRAGFGFRSVVASGPVAARQFALLLPDAERVIVDADASILRALEVESVPALVLLDATHRRQHVLPLGVPVADTIQLRRELLAFR